MQVEVYAFDLENLGEQGQAVLDSVKESGQFPMLDNQVPATLSGSGQYMMIYTDNSTSAENTAQKERVLGLFQGFYSE